MAESAVLCERVSGLWSCFCLETGKEQGMHREILHRAQNEPAIDESNQELSEKFPAPGNREFFAPEQGGLSQRSGKSVDSIRL